MSTDEIPYICECGFCEEGLLRFRSCPECEAICAVCDECELVWEDIAEVSVSRALINRYKHNLKAYCEALQTYCTRRGMTYALAGTEGPFDQIVMGYLRRRGLLR